ncbi:hypothetical protein [Sorangium cellulosum]|uniref:hypothetical protein n=1 Tax=Sorangium cellulosum TaxID=56 RepID=UPI0013ED89BB|nr:hypothetical protein [Sorangium cellulosum]
MMVHDAPSGSPQPHGEQPRVSSMPPWKTCLARYGSPHVTSPSWKMHVRKPPGGRTPGWSGDGMQVLRSPGRSV